MRTPAVVAADVVQRLQSHLARMYGVDARALVIFRFALGLLLFYDLLERTGLSVLRPCDVTIFYSDDGLQNRQELSRWSFSIFNGTGSPSIVWLLFLAGMYADLSLARGVNTKPAAFVALLVHMGAYCRAPRTFLGADIIAVRCLFIVAADPFLPLEGCRLQKNRQPPYVLSVGAVALVVCQALIYLGAGLSKGYQVWMIDGTPIRDSLESPFYGGKFGAQLVLRLPVFVLQLFSQCTVVGEIVAGLLLVFPVVHPEFCRFMSVLIIVGLQTGLILTMRLGCFPWFSIVSALPLFPRQFWNFLLAEDWHICSRLVEPTLEMRASFDKCTRWFWDILRIVACCLGLAWVVVTTFSRFPDCSNATVAGYGCALPVSVRGQFGISIPREMEQFFETVGLTPFAFDMFNVPRSDHGWLIAIGQELESRQVVLLPTGSPVFSAEDTFSRPGADWFPTMRWRQFWFGLSASDDEAIKEREQLASYFCRAPPNEGKNLERIQFYFTPNLFTDWNSKIVDYPLARPTRILNWLCTKELVEQWKTGECTECEASLMPIPEIDVQSLAAAKEPLLGQGSVEL